MRRQQKHTDEQRAATMALLEANNDNVAKTARTTGLSQSTIRNWRNGKGVVPPDVVTEKKVELAELFKAEAQAALEAAKACRDDARYRELMTGAGIATDKWQLLTGGATARVEHDVVIDAGDDGRA